MTHHNPTWRDPAAWLEAVRASRETPPELKFDPLWGVYPPIPTSAFQAASKWATESEALIRQNPHLSVEAVLLDYWKTVGLPGGAHYVLKRHWVYGDVLEKVLDEPSPKTLKAFRGRKKPSSPAQPTQHVVDGDSSGRNYCVTPSSAGYRTGDYVRSNGTLYRVGLVPAAEPTVLNCVPAHIEVAWDKLPDIGTVHRSTITEHWPAPRVALPESGSRFVRAMYDVPSRGRSVCVADSRVWITSRGGWGWQLLGSAAKTPIPEDAVQVWPPAALRAEIEQQRVNAFSLHVSPANPHTDPSG